MPTTTPARVRVRVTRVTKVTRVTSALLVAAAAVLLTVTTAATWWTAMMTTAVAAQQPHIKPRYNATAVRSLGQTGGNGFCALLADGTAKCWRGNSVWYFMGTLGFHSYYTTGGYPEDVRGELMRETKLTTTPGVSVTKLATPCALLSDGSTKCWYAGLPEFQQPGYPPASGVCRPRMGDALPAHNWTTAGPSVWRATDLCTGGEQICVVLSYTGTAGPDVGHSRVKCIGHNWAGTVGMGDIFGEGIVTAAGDNLPFVSLGSQGYTNNVTAVACGNDVTCAVVRNATNPVPRLKCVSAHLTSQAYSD